MPDVLIDSSFMIALNNLDDKNRPAAVHYIVSRRDPLLIPDVTLSEIGHLLRIRVGQRAVLVFLNNLYRSDGLHLVPVEKADLRRAYAIMRQYSDNNFDLVDCCIMALAERLNITQILTFDRRDFGVFRPAHTPYFELLP